MKRKLLFVACALMLGTSPILAQGWTASEVAADNYYLYNVGANAYLENGSSWGTHAALKSNGFVVNIAKNGDKYTIGTNSKYSGKYFTDNGYVDTASPTDWTFEPVAGLTNTYKIKTNAGYYIYAAPGMYNVKVGSDPGNNKAYWKLVTSANREDVSGASATNPIELTYKLSNPRFDDDNSGWQDAPARGGNTAGTNNQPDTYDDRNPCAEHYNKTYDTYQELTGLENGVYAVSVQGFYREGGYTAAATKHNAGTESLNAILYANGAEQPLMSIFEEAGKASGGGTATTAGIDGVFPNDMAAASYFFSAGLYWNKVYVEVTDGTLKNGTLKIGIKKSTSVGADWTIFDNFRLEYFGSSCTIAEAKLGPSISALASAVSEAQAYIDGGPALSATQIEALQDIVDDNDNDPKAFTTKEEFDTAISNIETALTSYRAMVAPYAAFNALKASANAIADVDYTETTSGSHSTFATAISNQTAAADNASTAAAINTATAILKAAIKTYINGAEPENEGEYFDITCLMTNPDFEDSHNGWTYISAPGVSWSNCEYYQSEFDINQTVTGLPTGSYSLSVQAFQRPGWAGAVYDAYIGGTDNASSVLYINSITSKVKNIAADAQNAYKLGDGSNFGYPNDSRVGTEGSYKFLPNSQQGSKLYFDAGLYNATCAAVVTAEDGGSLKLGFKSTKDHVEGDWTIFDNFRLYYYGSSLLVYYQQYWPQLKAEAEADLSNGAYANVLISSEDEALDAALAATPSTESEYSTAITTLTAAQAAFQAAATSYDALVAAKAYADLTEITANIGTGVFQYPENTPGLWTAYSEAKDDVDDYVVSTSSTAAAVQTLVDALDDAIEAYNSITLNAPADGNVFNVMITTGDDYAFKNNPLTFNADNVSGAYFGKNVGVKAHLAQQITFTKVEGNKYTLSMVNADGSTVYVRTNATDKGGDGTSSQIRLTTTPANALAVEIVPTSTDGVYNLRNTEANALLGCQDNPAERERGGLFTCGVHNDFTITAATKPSVNVNVTAANKYGTRIYPFKPTKVTGLKYYSCEAASGNTLTLVEVDGDLAANTPYIVENTTDPAATVDDTQTGYGTATADNATAGWLTGVYTNTYAEDGWYVLQNNGGKVGFYLVDTSVAEPEVGAYRCYLTIGGGGSAKAFFFPGDDEATVIEGLDALTAGEYEAIYTMGGVKVNALQKGTNIVQLKSGKTLKINVK